MHQQQFSPGHPTATGCYVIAGRPLTWNEAYCRMQNGCATFFVMACSQKTCSGHCTTADLRMRLSAYDRPVDSSASITRTQRQLAAPNDENPAKLNAPSSCACHAARLTAPLLYRAHFSEGPQAPTCDDGHSAERSASQHRPLRKHQGVGLLARCPGVQALCGSS